MKCSLCNSDIKDRKSDNKGKIYHICHNCKLIQLDREFYLSREEEKQRYRLHENSAENKGYLKYLNSIITNSISPFLKPENRLFDFGCGPEKTWAGLLKGKGYNVSSYDPFFDNNSEWINKIFDAITAIEVFEHLLSPAAELEILSLCLKRGSFLIIRTMLHNNNWESFLKWWYREDPTHVSFYSETAIMYICRRWNYELVQIKNHCEIVLRKK
ncbi:MAG: class I SAM-dependent methyltransferase [Spirochaetales bacterium]|nr:class I SAM-dependent methyltransferase [Spirochaetales bacterium]